MKTKWELLEESRTDEESDKMIADFFERSKNLPDKWKDYVEVDIVAFEPCSKNIHGTEFDIWLCSNGYFLGNADEVPRIELRIEQNKIEITIEENPKIYCGETTEDISEVIKFIKTNYQDLNSFWYYDTIDFDKLIDGSFLKSLIS